MSKPSIIELANFEQLQKVHSSPFYEIYQVKENQTGKIYAAKISLEEINEKTQNVMYLFFREANMLSKIHHPSIIEYIGFSPNDFNKNSKPVIIQELCVKGSLYSYLDSQDNETKLTETQKMIIIFGIASGMLYLHSNKIIFRNLNANNILLDENLYPKISGLSLAITNDESKNFFGIEGNFNYISPEIWQKGKYSEASDVYAFGIIVYQILTGKLPFGYAKSYELYQKVIEKERPDFASSQISESFKNLIQICCEDDVSKRPSFEQIVSDLKTNLGFINDTVDKEKYMQYIDYIQNSKSEFNSDKHAFMIDDEILNRPIDLETMDLLKKDPNKILYFVIQEVKQELKKISIHFDYFHNFDIEFDINKLKNDICNQFLKISGANANDPKIKKTLEYIKKNIDEEHAKLLKKLNKDQIIKSTKDVLMQIRNILFSMEDEKNAKEDNDNDNKPNNDGVKSQKYQDKINKILDNHPENLLINKEKLREIPSSKTDLNEILASLDSIERSMFDDNSDELEKIGIPRISVLYSPKEKSSYYSQSMSNILIGDCFFITLYGKLSCTSTVLSFLSNHELEEHKLNDIITVYGPVNIVSFAKLVPNSFNFVKNFNNPNTNLFFFEISSEFQDPNYAEWCEFFSFISHMTIFCSDENPNQKQISDFQKFLLTPFSNSRLINCSPYPNALIGVKKPQVNIDFANLNNNLLRSFILTEIFKMRNQFIPSQTASSYSYKIIVKKMKNLLKENKSDFHTEIIKDFAYQKHNDSMNYYKEEHQKTKIQLFEIAKSNKYYDSFHLDDHLNHLIGITQEYFYTCINSELWGEQEVKNVSTVITNEVKNNFEWLQKQYKDLETIGKLIYLLQLKDNKSYLSEAQSLLNIIKTLNEGFKNDSVTKDMKPESNKELIQKLENYYSKIVKDYFQFDDFQEKERSMLEQLKNFLYDNPTSSDQEYGMFLSKLIAKNAKSENQYYSKLIYSLTQLRPISEEYLPKEYYVKVDKRSFNQSEINILSDEQVLIIPKGTTCKELYDMVKELFDIKDIPYYITRYSNNTEVEIFKDDNDITQLSAYSLTIHYGIIVYSTKNAIESLVIQKTINIADDFIIKASSKNADYHVTFPPDHDGWFDVPFEITNNSPTSDTDEALIYLKMNASNISYLQEGNAIKHQYLQGTEWVTSPEPVFLSYPNCDIAVIYLDHCSEHRITTDETFIANLIPSEKQNTQYSCDWEGKNPDTKYSRGGRPYYLPVGFKSIGIKVQNFIENSCVAFHGTPASKVKLIMKDGFKKPSQIGGVRSGHIKLGTDCYGIINFPDAIFTSPSIKYASWYGKNIIIAKGPDGTFVESGNIEHKMLRIIVLQVRVIPNSFTIHQNTTTENINDQHYKESELEWRIADTKNLFPYRLLYKHYSEGI
ncbi:hypothetical protein M9Y10_001423 [Tritrichomonas musculus]|uniref:Protein kinase domain-containing protein n=1 Tax=Tritrichomonas musculus TaxID=1915356 RepID=A0ABR2L702_9EUKA